MTAAQALYRVPVLGWMTREAVEGPEDAKYYFMGNVLLLLALGIWIVGYPLLIILALTATALGLGIIVVFTAADMFEQKGSRPTPARPSARGALRR